MIVWIVDRLAFSSWCSSGMRSHAAMYMNVPPAKAARIGENPCTCLLK